MSELCKHGWGPNQCYLCLRDRVAELEAGVARLKEDLAAANADAERLVREKKAAMDGLPQTVKEAVRVLYAMMEPDEIEEALKQTVDDAWRYHHGVGRSIRNRMGLWSGNVALLTDCGYPPGSTDVPADEASGVIIRELIRYVHSLHEEEMILALDANRSLRECDLHGKYTGIALVVGPCHVLIRPRLAAHEVLLKGEAGV